MVSFVSDGLRGFAKESGLVRFSVEGAFLIHSLTVTSAWGVCVTWEKSPTP